MSMLVECFRSNDAVDTVLGLARSLKNPLQCLIESIRGFPYFVDSARHEKIAAVFTDISNGSSLNRRVFSLMPTRGVDVSWPKES